MEDTEQLILETLLNNSWTWIRCYNTADDVINKDECVVLRASSFFGNTIQKFIDIGFRVDGVRTTKIHADVYSDITLKRPLKKGTIEQE